MHPIEVNHSTKELSGAKQIYLGLKMYAMDHGDAYPGKRLDGTPFPNSNEVFRLLVPDYIRDEKIFYSKRSAWTPKAPDGKIGGGKTLAAGENCFAYVPHQTSFKSNLNLPLIASGFGKGTPGTYPFDPKTKKRGPAGGVAVVRNDGSGMRTKIGEDGRVYGRDGTRKQIDLFKPAPGWLAPDQVPLNPE